MEDIKLSEKLNVANIAIQNYLTNSLKSFGSGNIVDGMRYALLGGKGLRGFLVITLNSEGQPTGSMPLDAG